jgi:flavin reductase (DIM6/NTAB) family NADH-FMN oxidoreductase RutF
VTALSAEHVQATFRETMAAVCTPVTVITAIRSGQPFGTTVSAFASLSLDPPMVLVSLGRTSDLLGVIREVGEFGVNVLSSHQAPTAVRFATKGGSAKFNGVRWHAEAGVPRLPGGCCFLLCTVARLVDGGDHIIVLGEVAAADSTADAPLTYHSRTFGTHTILPRHGIRSCHLAEDAHPATTAHRVPPDWLAPWVHGFWLDY